MVAVNCPGGQGGLLYALPEERPPGGRRQHSHRQGALERLPFPIHEYTLAPTNAHAHEHNSIQVMRDGAFVSQVPTVVGPVQVLPGVQGTGVQCVHGTIAVQYAQ